MLVIFSGVVTDILKKLQKPNENKIILNSLGFSPIFVITKTDNVLSNGVIQNSKTKRLFHYRGCGTQHVQEEPDPTRVATKSDDCWTQDFRESDQHESLIADLSHFVCQ